MDQQLSELQAELQQLKHRVAVLEAQAAFTNTNTLKPAAVPNPNVLATNTTPPKKSLLLAGLSEERIAGTWFNRVGILAIMLAAAFFLKWSFDNHLIGELGRIVIGVIWGLAFLGTGEYFERKNFHIYAQGFTGGGIAIMYFSIFSAFSFYHLISQPIAFLLMVLITLAASLLAVRFDSPTIGIIGIVGGFATPFVLSTGESNQVILFTYVAILDAGVLLVAYFKKWPVFNYLTFILTYISFMAGNSVDAAYDLGNFNAISFVYLTLFFTIYLGVSFTRNIRLRESFIWADISLILLNAGTYFALSYDLLITHFAPVIGFWAVFLGLIYLAMGTFIYRCYTDTRNLSLTLLAIAAGFITLAVPLQFDGNWVTISWAVEAMIVYYLNLKMNPVKIPLAGFLILVLTIISLFALPFAITGMETWIFLNQAAVTYIVVILSMTYIIWLYKGQVHTSKDTSSRALFLALQIMLNLLIIVFFTKEIGAYYSYRSLLDNPGAGLHNSQDLMLSTVWGLHAAILVALGFWRRRQGIRWFGLGFLVFVIFKVFLYDLSNLQTPYRILSFLGLGIILLAISWIYHRYKNQILGEFDHEDTAL